MDSEIILKNICNILKCEANKMMIIFLSSIICSYGLGFATLVYLCI